MLDSQHRKILRLRDRLADSEREKYVQFTEEYGHERMEEITKGEPLSGEAAF